MPHREGDSVAVADQLVWRGFVNVVMRGCTTPLYIAAKCGHLEVAKYLVRAGADVNAADKNGFAPLHIAIGNLEVAKYLVTAGADGTLHTRTAPRRCMLLQHRGILRRRSIS